MQKHNMASTGLERPGDESADKCHGAYTLRPPQGNDAVAIRDIAAATGTLDVNSVYAYYLLATDFAGTSIVAARDDRIHGFITGYHPPRRPDVLFIWQVAVAPDAQGGGLAGALIDALVDRVRRRRRGHPVVVEATVAPSNTASRAFFAAFARRHGVPLAESAHITGALLDPTGGHEDEPLLRIGPLLDWRSDRAAHLQSSR